MKVVSMKYLDFLYLGKESIQSPAIHNNSLEIKKVQHNLPQPFDESYTHDTRGNRLTSLTHSYTYNDLNQLTDSTTHTHSYDADGNLIKEKNKLTTETKKYYYNSENRLIMVEHYPNDVSPADIVANYKYDIYGRRLQKNVNGTIINFSWEDDNLALELDENLQPIRRYVYGVGKDDVEGYVELSEVTGGMFDQYKQGWYSYIKDQVGTIHKVYSDNAQQMIDTRTYDVFGNIVNQTGSSTGNLGFHSKYYDQESGLNYFYHRYYNPVSGRFINEDPLRLNGGLNMYGFVHNNPITWLDPFGLQFITPEDYEEENSKGIPRNIIKSPEVVYREIYYKIGNAFKLAAIQLIKDINQRMHEDMCFSKCFAPCFLKKFSILYLKAGSFHAIIQLLYKHASKRVAVLIEIFEVVISGEHSMELYDILNECAEKCKFAWIHEMFK